MTERLAGCPKCGGAFVACTEYIQEDRLTFLRCLACGYDRYPDAPDLAQPKQLGRPKKAKRPTGGPYVSPFRAALGRQKSGAAQKAAARRLGPALDFLAGQHGAA